MIRSMLLAAGSVMLYGLAACSAMPEQERSCMVERAGIIRAAWNRHEFVTGVHTVAPDWRNEAYKWARIECEYGRPIPAFYPKCTRASICSKV